MALEARITPRVRAAAEGIVHVCPPELSGELLRMQETGTIRWESLEMASRLWERWKQHAGGSIVAPGDKVPASALVEQFVNQIFALARQEKLEERPTGNDRVGQYL